MKGVAVAVGIYLLIALPVCMLIGKAMHYGLGPDDTEHR